jgi:hypothetical protein
MSTRRLQRLNGIRADGKRRPLLSWTATEAGRRYCFEILDPLAHRLNVERESLRGWYEDCLRIGLPKLYIQGKLEEEDAAFWESVERAAKARHGNGAFIKRWRELGAKYDAKTSARHGSTRNLLFLQVRTLDLPKWWDRYRVLMGDARNLAAPIPDVDVRARDRSGSLRLRTVARSEDG